MGARRVTLRVQPPIPFGDVTMVPATLSGRPEADMARAMAAALGDIEAPTATDVYNRPRQSFPLAPLGARSPRSASSWNACGTRFDAVVIIRDKHCARGRRPRVRCRCRTV